jgi:hypothetical protein
MKKLNWLIVGLLTLIPSSFALAGAHVEHGGKNPNTPSACKMARIGKLTPAPLSEVAAGSEFSFKVYEVHNPKLIEVTVKNSVIPITVEHKTDFVVVHGKLPQTVKGMAARVIAKVKGKLPKCNTEEGWLLKITE